MSHQDWKPIVFNNIKASKSSFVDHKKVYIDQKIDEDGNPVKKSLPKDFGSKMQRARSSKGLTQKQLAQKLNCKLTDVQQYEQGKIVNPNKAFARRIEKTLGASLF
jgi:ribosome-binding protein aMBF1 (putative translation factor)